MYRLRSHDDFFMAGLWRKTLLLDMMWTAPFSQVLERPKTWRAPTWSWASVQGQVIWDPRLESIFDAVDILDVHCDTQGPPELGNISSKSGCNAVFRAPLINATWRKPWVRSRWPQLLMSGAQSNLDVNRYCPDYDYDLADDYHIPWESEVFLVPLAIACIPLEDNYQDRRDGAGGIRHLGLGLRKVGNPKPSMSFLAVYERIGYVEIVEEHAQANMSVTKARDTFDRVDQILRSLHREIFMIV